MKFGGCARPKNLKKLKGTIQTKTRRTNGQSLPAIVTNLDCTLTGWFEYFKPSRKSTFAGLDYRVRRRVPSIVCHRRGGHGCGRGWDRVQWSPAFFAAHGLFSLVTVHAEACQSSRRWDQRPESRMRENRPSGSVGGEPKPSGSSPIGIAAQGEPHHASATGPLPVQSAVP